jgi:NMD protein affecting ribosome stability and mRNA decay
MSKWTHSLCDRCYANLEPCRTPIRLLEVNKQVCRRCGIEHESGIYYRADPTQMNCGGKHV